MIQSIQAEFLKSSSDYTQCPPNDKPEYAFIGRSNVGKSSLINMLTGRKNLAKISGKPGKTQLINHFAINKEWYLVDLPGYGYAGVSKEQRSSFQKLIKDYCENRDNLVSLFVLIDSRHDLQKNDQEFMEYLAETGLSFCIVFTKIDKLSSSALQKNRATFDKSMLKHWEELPTMFISSSTSNLGKEDIIGYIKHWNEALKDRF